MLQTDVIMETITELDGVLNLSRFEQTCCMHCKYFDGVQSCPAYPKGIPDKFAIRNVLGLMVFHSKIEKGQIGTIIFEPA